MGSIVKYCTFVAFAHTKIENLLEIQKVLIKFIESRVIIHLYLDIFSLYLLNFLRKIEILVYQQMHLKLKFIFLLNDFK